MTRDQVTPTNGGKKELKKPEELPPILTPSGDGLPDNIPLTQPEQDGMRALERVVLERQAMLGDLQMAYEQRKSELLQGLQIAMNAKMERAKLLAETHGLKTDDPAVRWNLDTTKMVFHRLK